MIYLGPDSDKQCFKMFNPKTNRIIRTREVNFDEMTLGLPSQ